MDNLRIVENKEGMYAKYRRKRKLLENRFRVFITPSPPLSPPGEFESPRDIRNSEGPHTLSTPPPPLSPPVEIEPLPDDIRTSERDQTPTQNNINTYNGTSPIQSDSNLFDNTQDQSQHDIRISEGDQPPTTPPPPLSPPGVFEPSSDNIRNSERDQTPTQNHTNTHNETSLSKSDSNLFENTQDQLLVENDMPSKDTDERVVPGKESPPLEWGESQELEDQSGKETPEVRTNNCKVFGEENERSTSSLAKNVQSVQADNSAEGIDEIISEQSPRGQNPDGNSIASKSEGDLNFDENTRQKTPEAEAQLPNTVNENGLENQDGDSQNHNMVMKSISEEDMENVSVTGNTEIESARLEENAPVGEDLNQLKFDSEIKAETPPNMTNESVHGDDK